MVTRTVNLPGNAYDILIEHGLLCQPGVSREKSHSTGQDEGGIGHQAAALIKPFTVQDEPVALVTDENVWACYGTPFLQTLHSTGIDAHATVLPPGEANKSLDGLATLYNAFTEMKLKRQGLVIALGGGVIGDLCGFASATYLRGIAYIQIPTTLLAQVDSSIGGKTAINLKQGKNLAGAFYHPRLVIIDPSTLDTLPQREYRCGMAEVIKYGAIRSKAMFDRLQEPPDPDDMAEIIGICCDIKADIVQRDEKDTGERMLLNFGHTFGHALEAAGNYTLYNHGEGVSAGMVLAARIGEDIGLTEPGTSDALQGLLAVYGLDARFDFPLSALLPLLEADKKSGAGQIQMVLLRHIGDAFVHPISYAELRAVVARIAKAFN